MNQLTIEQKLELIKIASNIGAAQGSYSADLKTTLEIYQSLLKAIISTNS